MAKVTLANITSDYASRARHNANYAAMAAAMENTLSRDGSLPNHMTANLDLNSKRILNLKAGIGDNDAVNLAQLYDVIAELVADQDIDINITYHNTMVENLTALRAYTGTALVDGNIFYVKGHTTAGDGGGGVFLCTDVDPGITDNDFYVDSSTAGFWFIRQMDGRFLTPLMFGADPNGVVDSTDAFQKLLDQGGLAYIPAGEYILASSLQAVDPIFWVGEGTSLGAPGSVIRSRLDFTAATSTDRFVFGDASEELYGVHLEKIAFTNSAATGGSVLFFNRCAQSTIDDVALYTLNNTEHAIKVFKTNTIKFDNNRIVNPITSGYYIYADSNTNRSDVIEFANCVVSGDALTTATHIPNALSIDGEVHTVTIHGFKAVGTGRGIWRHNSIGGVNRSFFDFAHDVEVDFPYYEAIRYDWGSGGHYVNLYAHGSVTENNIFIDTEAVQTITDFSFIGGQCSGAYKNGMVLNGRYQRVIGMQVWNNSQAGSGSYDGIVIGGDSSNTIVGLCHSGQHVGMTAENQNYGVHILAGALTYLVGLNDLTNNVTGALLDESGSSFGDSSFITIPNTGQISPQSATVQTATAGGSFQCLKQERLTLTAASTLASFTVILPQAPAHLQNFYLYSQRAITAFTLTPGSGHSISTIGGSIASLTAESSLHLWFDEPTLTWYPQFKNGVS